MKKLPARLGRARYMIAALGLSSALLSCSGSNSDTPAHGNTVSWERAYIVIPAGAGPAVMYAVLHNGSAHADTLVRVTTPLADSVSLHTNVMSGDMSSHSEHQHVSMQEVPAIALPQDSLVALSPGGYHVMLSTFKQAVARGDSVPVTFHFAGAGALNGHAVVIDYGDVDTATSVQHGAHTSHSH